LINQPRLMQGHTLTEKARLHPSTLQLTLNLDPCSSASMTLLPNDAEVSIGDWVRLYSTHGDEGIFIVNSIKTDYVTGVRTVNLEHAMSILRNSIIFGEMGGKKTDPGMMIRNILAKQDTEVWRLGECGYNTPKPWSFNNVTLFDALNTMYGSLESPVWSFDCSSLPFRLSLKPRSTEVACEMRMNRGISGVNVTVDATDMYTRFYPVGMNDIHVTGDYLERNTDTYGVITVTKTDQSISSVDMLQAWAEEELRKHAEPQVSVSVTGSELSKLTGLSFDRILPGTVCRIPLPDYNTTITGYIQTVSYNDVMADESAMQVTLGNKRTNVASIVEKVAKGGGGGATASNKEYKLMWTEINQNDEAISLAAYKITGLGTDVGMLQVKYNEVSTSVLAHTDSINTMAARISAMSNQISLVVQETAGTAVINTASIIAAINNGSSSVQISADKINLAGSVWADELSATKAELNNLKTGITTASRIQGTVISATSSLYVSGTKYARKAITINGTTYYVLAQ